jgi:TolB-like protein/tetratricopeptide (TPR) repeat protein
MPDVFLSYSREDQATARRFAEAFQQAGLSVWWDQTLTAGEAYDEVTEQALKSARAVVVLWSKSSVASRWVRAEATIADRNGTMVPVMTEPCERPVMFELRQSEDLSAWTGDVKDPAWRSFLAGVRRMVGRDRSAAGAKPDVPPAAASAPVPAPDPFRRVRSLLATAAVLIAALVGAWLFLKAQGRTTTTATAAAAVSAPSTATAPADEGPSIAVLPFVNMSSDPEQEYFSDGLSEELLNELTRVPKLRVIGRTSSFAFKGKNQDLRSIGETLGVNHILSGSVRKSGDRVRINAQLINPIDGSQVWSDVYERKLEDIFAIQEEIARTVAQALRLTLATGAVGGTRNFAAYDEFLAGRAGLSGNGGSMGATSVAHLERAVALDPEYITAWLWLIDAYTRQLFALDQRDGARARQVAAIKRVEALAPDSRYAQIARSYDALVRPDLMEADRLLSAFLDAPSNIGLRTQLRYGQFLGAVGRRADSLEVLQQVQAADPLDLFSRMQLMSAYAATENYAQARAELERILQQPGGDVPLARAQHLVLAMLQGDHAAVLAEIDTHRGFNGVVGNVLAMHKDNLKAALPELSALLQDDRFNKDPFVVTDIARWSGYLGAPDVALDALRRMPARGLSFETWAGFLWGGTLGEMRQTPGFKAFVRELGLVDYWRSSGKWGDFCKPVGTDDFECH